MKTTILFVDHTPFSGGAQLVLAEHIKQLDKKKYQPIVACTNTVPLLAERYQQAGATVEIIDMPKLKQFKLSLVSDFLKPAKQLRQLVAKHSVDLVVSNTARASYLCFLAVIGSRTPLIWWVRDYLYQQLLFKVLLWRVSRVICVSHSIKDHYLSLGNPKGVVVYVASSLYQQLEKITDQQRQTNRQQWGIGDKDVVIGFMGRLVKEKGPDVLVEAVTKLHPQYPQLKAMIVGTGHNQMHDIEPELKKRVEELSAQEYLILTGYQTEEALYYKSFDLFSLNTIDAEPFATTVVQAMMAKLVVIATDAGGTAELVKHNQTGKLVEPGSVDSLATAIEEVLQQPELAQSLSQRGYQQVMAEHREETVTMQVCEIYQQVLGAKP